MHLISDFVLDLLKMVIKIGPLIHLNSMMSTFVMSLTL